MIRFMAVHPPEATIIVQSGNEKIVTVSFTRAKLGLAVGGDPDGTEKSNSESPGTVAR
jgi:hypothetical protein